MEPVIKEITVETTVGPHQVKAGVYGPVAVHRTIIAPPLESQTYSVTHVETGRSLCSVLTRDQAIRVADRIGQERIWRFRTLDQFRTNEKQLKRSFDAAVKLAGRESHEAARRGDGGPMPRRALPDSNKETA